MKVVPQLDEASCDAGLKLCCASPVSLPHFKNRKLAMPISSSSTVRATTRPQMQPMPWQPAPQRPAIKAADQSARLVGDDSALVSDDSSSIAVLKPPSGLKA